MSSDPAIRFDSISKSYRLALDAHRSLRGAKHRTFRALEDVSFDVDEGQVVGLIGANGAGKSTLLKILSRVTSPDSGTVTVRGRVGSLLEVGTGFHPELTGRENIFLNGSILGMGRREIARRFDEIVAFSEINDDFLETPVKRYSSGMYVRLAFSVASHLSSEILVVDEVLAVGDGAFQSKCMAKMESLATEEGRTILLVTHNLTPVRRLCDRAVYLKQGSVQIQGDVTSVLERYLEDTGTLRSDADGGHVELQQRTNIHPPHELLVQAMTVRGADGEPTRLLHTGETATVDLRCQGLGRYPSAVLAVRISTAGDGAGVASFVHRVPDAVVGESTWRMELPRLDLAPGDYEIDSGVLAGPGGHVLDEVRGAMRCRVASRDMDPSEWKRLVGDGVAVLPASWANVSEEVSR